MFRKYSIVCILIFVLGNIANSGQEPNVPDAEVLLRQRLNELERLLKKYWSSLGKVRQVAEKAMTLTTNGTVSFHVYNGDKREIHQAGGVFTQVVHATNKNPHVFLSKKMLLKYRKHPSIVYSVLMYLMHNIHDYAKNKEHFLVVSDKPEHFEHFFYQLDAYTTEAIFINKVLIPEKMKLTKFERLLGGAFKHEHYNTFTTFVMHADHRVMFSLYGIYHNQDTLKKSLESMTKIGEECLKQFKTMKKKKDIKPYEKYYAHTMLHTFLKFGISFYVETIKKKTTYTGPPKPFGLDYHPPFAAVFKQIHKTYEQYSNWNKYGPIFYKQIAFM